MSVFRHADNRELARVEIFAVLVQLNAAAAAKLRSRTRLEPDGKLRLANEINRLDQLITGVEPTGIRAALDAHQAFLERLARTGRASTESDRVLIELGFALLPLIAKLRTLVHICEAFPLEAQRRARAIDPERALQ